MSRPDATARELQLRAFLATPEGRTVTPGELSTMIEISQNEEWIAHVPGAACYEPGGAFPAPNLAWMWILTFARCTKANLTEERKARLEPAQDLGSKASNLAREIGLALSHVVLLESTERDAFSNRATSQIAELRATLDKIDEILAREAGAADA